MVAQDVAAAQLLSTSAGRGQPSPTKGTMAGLAQMGLGNPVGGGGSANHG